MKPTQALADAEFIGLFMGEGHLDLAGSRHGRSLSPRVRVSFRDDDLAALEYCRARFGGSITRRPALRAATWQLTGRAAVTVVIQVLECAVIPCKKRAEVVLMREALGLIGPRGKNVTDATAARLHAIRDELKALRAYKAAID